jgi:hypothetical protein
MHFRERRQSVYGRYLKKCGRAGAAVKVMIRVYGRVFCDYGFSAEHVIHFDYEKTSKFERNPPCIYVLE